MNNVITTNKKEVMFCFSLPIGPNTIFNKKTKIFLVKSIFNKKTKIFLVKFLFLFFHNWT